MNKLALFALGLMACSAAVFAGNCRSNSCEFNPCNYNTAPSGAVVWENGYYNEGWRHNTYRDDYTVAQPYTYHDGYVIHQPHNWNANYVGDGYHTDGHYHNHAYYAR